MNPVFAGLLVSLLSGVAPELQGSTICAVAAAGTEKGPTDFSTFATCTDVARKAVRQDVDAVLAVAVAWSESRFDPQATSARAAQGPMQVMPRYWCPERRAEGCDLAEAGVSALNHYLDRHEKPLQALCHYNAGNVCGPRGVRYARYVLSTARHLRRLLRIG